MVRSLSRAKALIRLQKDLIELADRAWELPTVSALPLESNMFEWHCNILGTGDQSDIVLHMKLLFPDTYPHQPPEVVLMSKVTHPHVFGDHLSLDMLEEGQYADAEERSAEFTGWSTCYSVFSILMQLQSFLFDLGTDPEATRHCAANCNCYCGHGSYRTYPPLPEVIAPPPPRPAVASNPFAEDEDHSCTEEDADLVKSEAKSRKTAEAAAAKAKEGEKVSGNVVSVMPYGVFIKLGPGSSEGQTGLLRRSEMLRNQCDLEVGDQISCRVKSWDPKLSLTCKMQEADLSRIVRRRQRVHGKVVGVKPFGVFVDIGGVSGLLHRKEMNLVAHYQRIPYELGDTVKVRVLEPEKQAECAQEGAHRFDKISVSTNPLFLLPTQPRILLDGDADLTRLQCFHSKASLSEDILGVGVSLFAEELPNNHNGKVKHYLTSIYDVLAHGSYMDGVRKGVWKQKFSFFLPLAFDTCHFDKAKACFESSIAKFASGRIAEMTRSHGISRNAREEEYNARMTLDQYRSMGTMPVTVVSSKKALA